MPPSRTIDDVLSSTGSPDLSLPPSAQPINTSSPDATGTGEQGNQLLNLSRDTRSLTLLSTDDIQSAINRLSELGGGHIKLLSGTYLLKNNLTIPSHVTIEGAIRDDVIIDCNTSYSVKINGSNAYTTGTVSVNNGSTTVTGSGTAWTASMVGQYIFLKMVIYQITGWTSSTSITIGNAYFGTNLSGETYAIADPVFTSQIRSLTIQNASGRGIDIQYASEPTIHDVVATGCGTGMYLSWVYAPVVITGCTLNGINGDWNNVTAFDINFSIFAQSTSGVGISFNNCFSATMFNSDFSGNTTNGLSLTNCSQIAFISISCLANGAKGIELVSGNSGLQFSSIQMSKNASDGIKLTASNTNIEIFGCTITENTGYGANVAASSNTDIIITTNAFDLNTAGVVNDLGASTIIRGNTGVSDNNGANVQTFTANGTWIKPTGAVQVVVEVWGGGGAGGSETTTGGAGGGGGGHYAINTFIASDLTATVPVTVGAAQTTPGSAGNNSTFGSYVTGYGGGGGWGGTSTLGGGGGGGGAFGKGSTATGTTFAAGGEPGYVGSSVSGATNPGFGGGSGGTGSNVSPAAGGNSVYGGGGGGSGTAGAGINGANGGNSQYGGGAGGGGCPSGTGGSGGTSSSGGAGGAGGSAGNGTDGIAPGGGGGGAGHSGVGTATGGSGARGQVRVTTYF